MPAELAQHERSVDEAQDSKNGDGGGNAGRRRSGNRCVECLGSRGEFGGGETGRGGAASAVAHIVEFPLTIREWGNGCRGWVKVDRGVELVCVD